MHIANSTLLGAARWLHELAVRDEDRARLYLRTTPGMRDLTPTQYEIALEWLKSKDLYPATTYPEHARSPGAVVLASALISNEPSWLPDADSLVRDPSELPIDVIELGDLLQLDPADMFDEVKRAWRKFDDAAQRELGSAGEAALVDWLHRKTSAEVIHVSLFDDSAGYDVALMHEGKAAARIEVKATRREDSVVVFLSRNELETMRVHKSWCLQVVHLDANDAIQMMSWIPPEALLQGAPHDGSLGTWQAMKMTLPARALRPGPAPQVTTLLSHR